MRAVMEGVNAAGAVPVSYTHLDVYKRQADRSVSSNTSWKGSNATNKLAIVYWSGTGNTETMANCIADGARESGAEVAMLSPGEFSATRFSEFGVVAFGCPAMGAEQLEEDEVEPMFAGLEGSLGGKKMCIRDSPWEA